LKPTALTPRQERFATEYLKDLNATQAAIRAGYSPRTANRTGPEYLSKPVVAREIARLQEQRLDASALSGTRILEELRSVALSNVRDLVDSNGNIRPLESLSPQEAATIQSFEVVLKNATAGDGIIDRVLKIKLWDKTKALDLAMQHLALLQTKPEPPKAPTVSIQVKSLALVLDANQLQAIRERLVSGITPNPAESGNGGRGAPVPEDAQV